MNWVVKCFQVPVYAGSNESLKFTPDTDAYFGEDGFGDFEYPNPPDPNKYLQKEYAPDAIVRLAEKYPGNNPYKYINIKLILFPEYLWLYIYDYLRLGRILRHTIIIT